MAERVPRRVLTTDPYNEAAPWRLVARRSAVGGSDEVRGAHGVYVAAMDELGVGAVDSGRVIA